MPFNKHLKLIGLFIVFYTFAGLLAVSGEEAKTLPRLKPLDEVNILLSQGEPYDLNTFIDAALIFSGTKYNNIYIAKSRILKSIATFKNFIGKEVSGSSNTPDTAATSRAAISGTVPTATLTPAAAEKVLEYLHKHILKAYSEKQTRIDVLFKSGIYNCVSSAVVYMVFAKSLGFTVKGIRTKDHAFCTVSAGGRDYDVETTSPYGFDPGKKKAFTDAFGRTTGYSYVPPGNYSDRITIGEKEMLALILYNRNAFLTEQRDFFNAVGPAADAYALLKDSESLERLAVSLNNAASFYGLKGESKSGIDFLKRAEGIYGNELIGGKLSENISKLYHNYVIELINRKDFSNAISVLNNAFRETYLKRPEWKNLTVYIYEVMARDAALGRQGTDTEAVVHPGSAYLRAAMIIERGIKAAGRDRNLLRNYEVYMHNAVVERIKAKDYTKAESIVNTGLKFMPGSLVLTKDKAFIKRAAGQ